MIPPRSPFSSSSDDIIDVVAKEKPAGTDSDSPLPETPLNETPLTDTNPTPPRLDMQFMLRHPAHWFALGFGSGLSGVAPGTFGTIWAWVAFTVLSPHLGDSGWSWVIGLSLPLGWWACAVTARHVNRLDPSCVVWDEVVAFWLVLWLVTPASFSQQFAAFALFRFFDAVKPGPVGWADRLFHAVDPQTDRRAWSKAGLGIMLDDLVAAGCTVLVIALWRFL